MTQNHIAHIHGRLHGMEFRLRPLPRISGIDFFFFNYWLYILHFSKKPSLKCKYPTGSDSTVTPKQFFNSVPKKHIFVYCVIFWTLRLYNGVLCDRN